MEGKYYGISHSWYCKNSLDIKRVKAPLNEWEQKGLLTCVDDVEINPALITDWLDEQSRKYNITKIAIDSYRYALFSNALKNIGFDANKKEVYLTRPSDQMRIVPVINSAFVNQNIIWGDNPLMRWYTNNAKLEPAPNNNQKYGKIEPKSRKTDGFMALVNAFTIVEEIENEHREAVFLDTLVF